MKNLASPSAVIALLSLLAWASPASAALGKAEEELLEPDKAFAMSVRARDAETVDVQWTIAKGYYMYREKFQFESLDPTVNLKSVSIPRGTRKRDEFFGDVETFRNNVKVSLPLTRNQQTQQNVKLRITSQGCADLGVCYPPQIREVNVNLPALAAASSPGEIKSLSDLTRLIDGGGKTPQYLPVDEAFKISIEQLDSQSLVARLNVAKGYYLYRDKTRFEISKASTGITLGQYSLPPGELMDDPYIGKTDVYHNPVNVILPLARTTDAGMPIELKVDYQGCANKGICYPPSTKLINLVLPPANAAVTPPIPGLGQVSPLTGAAQSSTKTWILALSVAFGTGLLLTFTPCVLPMIPILSSIIVGSAKGGQSISKLRGGLLSSSYVLGTAVTYTIAGAMAGASGDQLQAYFQTPLFISIFSVLFVLLALSMFGFYELQMPSFIQSRLQHHTQHVKGGSLLGTFVLGLLSALIVGACVSPLFISALGVAITSKDPWLGGGIMFAMSLGMGAILIAIGVGAGFLLPKAGPWMDKVKYVFGVMLLAVAIYFLSFLPEVPVLLLWAALFIITGVYLGATQSLPRDTSGWQYLWKGVGTLALIWGVLALIGGFAGERDILKPLPLSGIASIGNASTASPASKLQFTSVTTIPELTAKFAEAHAQNKPIMLDYYATWCTDCIRMEKSTFTDSRVIQALGKFALIKADVTDNNADAIAIKKAYEVFGPPATLFFNADGREIRNLRFYGYRSPDEFLEILTKL